MSGKEFSRYGDVRRFCDFDRFMLDYWRDPKFKDICYHVLVVVKKFTKSRCLHRYNKVLIMRGEFESVVFDMIGGQVPYFSNEAEFITRWEMASDGFDYVGVGGC